MSVKEVKCIKGGEVLAKSIYTEEDNLLIPRGAVLKAEYIDLLTSLNIGYIEIEETNNPLQEYTLLINDDEKKYYVDKIQKLLENHIYTGKNSLIKVKNLAEELIQYVDNKLVDIVYDYDFRNTNLYDHTIMVTLLSLLVAKKLQLDKNSMYNIAVGCLLHDLGLRYITIPYINVDYTVADPADVFEYKKHTILAYTVIEQEEWLTSVSKGMILSHHERKNGSGFPLKQKNQNIECEIIQVCDALDCYLTGIECKRKNLQNIIDFISMEAGEQFDQTIVQTLVSMLAYYPVGTKVQFLNGKYGIVIAQDKQNRKPRVVMLENFGDELEQGKIIQLEKDSSLIIKNVIE